MGYHHIYYLASQTEIGNKKGGMLRRSFSKIGRILKPSRGGAKATLVHTAPEAYSRPQMSSKGRPNPVQERRAEAAAGGGRRGGGRNSSNGARGELDEASMYGDSDGGGENRMKPRRAFSDGMIYGSPEKRR